MISSKNIHKLSQVFDPVKFTPRAEQRTRWHPDRSALFAATVRSWRGSYRWALSLLAPAALLLALAHPAASRAQGGTWSPVKNLAPGSIWYSMILLPDGTIMGERIATPAVNIWNRLTPDRTGSYANGTWTTLPPMNETRNTNGHQVLRDGRLLVVGGEYGTGANNAEVYDPATNTWTLVINKSGGTQRYLDANTAVLPDGKVLIGPAVPAVRGLTFIYDPATNTINPGPTTVGAVNQAEANWVKLPDNSILTININTTVSQRYIPAQNQWIADASLPVNLWAGGEMGAGFLLPNGKVFFLGGSGSTALYTPSGTTALGGWVTGPVIPDGKSAPDGGGVMLVNGRVLFVAAPAPTATDEYPKGVSFYEYDYATNTIDKVDSPAALTSTLASTPNYSCGFLALPDGSALFTHSTSDLWIYRPNGAPLAAAKPAITSLTQNTDGSYHLVGTLLNGISEGAAYGDDAQISTNRPLVRITDAFGTVSYARTFNWSSSSVATGSTPMSTEFAKPFNGTYSLVVTANGVASDPMTLTVANSIDGPPSVTTQPIARAVQSGTTATFTVAAVGTGTFNYQWQAQEAGSTIWNNVANGNGVSGATTATLSIVTGAAQNGLSYRTLVQNTASVASDSATLLVASPITLSTISGAPGSSSPVTGTLTAARYSIPQGIALDAAGNIYVADTGHHLISKISVSENSVTTLAGTSGSAGVTDGPGAAARFSSPWGIAVDAAGNVYVADSGTTGNTIRRITPAGVVTTLAGSAGVAGSADGTGTAATFNRPSGLTVDATGTVYVCDNSNHTIRKVTPAGVVTTLAGSPGGGQRTDGSGAAARLGSPAGIALDPTTGNLIVVEGGNDSVRRVTLAGVVTTIAGNTSRGFADGLGRSARFFGPEGVAVNAVGEIFVADTFNHVIRRVSPTGVVTTIAGTATTSGSTDGTSAAALLNRPFALAISATGQLYIADTSNLTIRTAATLLPPLIANQPANQSIDASGSVSLTVATSGAATYLWQQNGTPVANGSSAILNLANLQPGGAGLYAAVVTNSAGAATSLPAIVGVPTTSEVIGAGLLLQPTHIKHPNGNFFDQILMTGAAETITAVPGQVARTSYIDLNDDIVQVEFAGAGTLSLVLDSASGPAAPVNYNQAAVSYMKGHAGIVIVGADETTNLSVFTVGRVTANDPTGGYNILQSPSVTNDPAKNGSSLFVGHASTAYDGVADIAFIAISSPSGNFGGLRASNASCFATKGLTGIYAPGVRFSGPVFISDISAHGTATPVFIIGSSLDTRITGGNLLQTNGQPVKVTGLTQLKFQAGGTSNNVALPAQTNKAVLLQNGADVSAQVVVNP